MQKKSQITPQALPKSGCFENCKILRNWNRRSYKHRKFFGYFILILRKKTICIFLLIMVWIRLTIPKLQHFLFYFLPLCYDFLNYVYFWHSLPTCCFHFCCWTEVVLLGYDRWCAHFSSTLHSTSHTRPERPKIVDIPKLHFKVKSTKRPRKRSFFKR